MEFLTRIFFLVEDLPQLLAGKILLFLVSGRGD